MNLYLENGYANMAGIINTGLPFIFCIGGRAIGKTYGALDYVVSRETPFMLMRRTQSQADIINKPEFSPIKPICRDRHIEITTRAITKYNAGFFNAENDSLIGMSCALSTVSNIRGFDASNIDIIIYDEFIPEKHERPLKNEGAALLNAYETMNRNRELQGRAPMQLLCLANANDPANPIFIELGLVKKVNDMMRKSQSISIDHARGIGIFIFTASPISCAKRDTALYKLSAGTDFAEMSLENSFTGIDYDIIKSRPLREYISICAISDICVYRHKSNGRFYVSEHTSGSPESYNVTDAGVASFRAAYSWLLYEYVRGNIDFESILCEKLLTKFLK